MNILLTNDDGIKARGLNTLLDVLSDEHNIYVVAPDSEKSACSSAITIRNKLKVEALSDKIFSVKGYPADCVNISLNGDIIPEKIDLVISGINHGPNLGDDIHFSGTVAAARTAFIFGVSGISVSLDCLSSSEFFIDSARFVNDFIRTIKKISYDNSLLININYPDIPKNKILGIKYTRLGNRKYKDSYRVIEKNGNEMSLKLDGIIDSREKDGTDITELKKGYITITPLSLDSTDYKILEKLKKFEEEWVKLN